ncbi:MAG: ATP synthase epsilon chain [bacterium]|nr:MAG: ATP synthase epsilon chain [bacterium]
MEAESEKRFRLEIVTPERKLVDKQVKYVSAPGSEGEFGVLAGHTEFFTTLGTGTISYEDEEAVHMLAVSCGYAEVKPESVVILAENAEPAREIDRERAIRDRERWEKELEGLSFEDKNYKIYQAKLDRAMSRILVASQHLEK